MIRFQQVNKQYDGGAPAVSDLNLEIPEGSITVFVGPSGCGKTTSLRMINRMVDPTSGTIEVDGLNIAEVAPYQLRRSMGYVMQAGGLMPHRTIAENIATVPRLIGTAKADYRRRVQELLETVGLDAELAGRYPSQLSGGQQQRVGVARALAADPPVLLMDEPFSAVDPVVRGELQNELLRLQDQLSKTIVFVTHDIDEAVLLGDHVAVMGNAGILQQFSPPDELLRAPANDFVAHFIGRDRGFRALSFRPATELRWKSLAGHTDDDVARAVRIPRSSTVRAALDAALTSLSGLALAVDEDGTETGLLDAEEIGRQIGGRDHDEVA
ncbi:MAG: ATP-binding cassette domain-containing protein [Micrococcaceae bacterium]|nr:ATP-binding cassette domain-containing protein [Micrococcaceae bacterium]MDN6201724.1 ATP-binding cassette domain-containing protein [Micrococcaceae bacterium]